ncbi:uncharacterized protein LOC117643013 [Thrips palmi]|uniref:Uncharacterized protein LOC117643013 n=1 Tax=Thrips palmi TaxID=161013 RepID=A0A6P8YTY2_THRPL|nr:uncharacterized protein LOC117643013 [Thrips palmi]
MDQEDKIPSPPAGPRPRRASTASPGTWLAREAERQSELSRPSGSLLMRGPRSRSAMSFRRPSSSRGSIASRNSRGTAIVDYGLSPGLQSLIGRLTNTKDVGLIAYLSAIPGEPHGATRPPAAINKLQQKQSGRPKSIMKISKATVRFEPTYRLEPLRPFRVDRALDQVKKALEMGMAEATYSPQWATDAVRILAAYITQCVKAVEMPAPCRYKIATMVTVLERRQQGVRTEGAVLWDDNLDRIISACVENNTMVACAVVYAVFWE